MRILIADDNQLVRRGVAEILSSLAGCNVCGEASNGLEAFQKSQEMRPDLVLLDISMPGTNGLETARLLRQKIPEMKILIITHHDSRSTIAECPRSRGRMKASACWTSPESL